MYIHVRNVTIGIIILFCISLSMYMTLYIMDMYMYIRVYTYMIKKRNNKATQYNNTGDNSFFPKKNELPQVGFEPTTLCSLDKCSTCMPVTPRMNMCKYACYKSAHVLDLYDVACTVLYLVRVRLTARL